MRRSHWFYWFYSQLAVAGCIKVNQIRYFEKVQNNKFDKQTSKFNFLVIGKVFHQCLWLVTAHVHIHWIILIEFHAIFGFLMETCRWKVGNADVGNADKRWQLLHSTFFRFIICCFCFFWKQFRVKENTQYLLLVWMRCGCY